MTCEGKKNFLLIFFLPSPILARSILSLHVMSCMTLYNSNVIDRTLEILDSRTAAFSNADMGAKEENTLADPRRCSSHPATLC